MSLASPSSRPAEPVLRLGAQQRRDALAQQAMRDSDATFLRDAGLFRLIVQHDIWLRPHDSE